LGRNWENSPDAANNARLLRELSEIKLSGVAPREDGALCLLACSGSGWEVVAGFLAT